MSEPASAPATVKAASPAIDPTVKCHLTEQSRLYTAMGAVFVKRMIGQTDEFVAFTYNPQMSRARARNAKLVECGEGEIVRIKTNAGPYEFCKDQVVRLWNNTIKRVTDLQPGDRLQALVLENRQGMIFAKTGNCSVALNELVEADLFDLQFTLTKFTPEKEHAYQTFQGIEDAGKGPLYDVVIDGQDKNDVSVTSPASFMMWPDGTSFGSGIFVF